MQTEMKVMNDGLFLRFGEVIINRAEVRGVHLHSADEFAEIFLKSEHPIPLKLPKAVVEAWFSDIMDYKPLYENGKLK